jgi:DDE superfamily endonuclease
MYEMIAHTVKRPYYIYADTAFTFRGDMVGKLRSRLDPAGAPPRNAHEAALHRLRQTAEWGWRSIKGKWCRLSGTLPFDPPFVHQVLKTALCLHNFSVRVGMPNQTRCVHSLASARARASRAVRVTRAVYFDSWKAAHPGIDVSKFDMLPDGLVDYNERRYLEDDRHEYPLFF